MTAIATKFEITEESTVDDVVEYMNKLVLVDNNLLKLNRKTQVFKYEEFAEAFLKECISGKVFFNLGRNELNELGVVQFGKRNALAKHIEFLRNEHQKKKHGIMQYTPSKSSISTMPKIIDENDIQANIEQNIQENLEGNIEQSIQSIQQNDTLNDFFENSPCDLPSIPNELNNSAINEVIALMNGMDAINPMNNNICNINNQYAQSIYSEAITNNNSYHNTNNNSNNVSNNYYSQGSLNQLTQFNQVNQMNQFPQLNPLNQLCHNDMHNTVMNNNNLSKNILSNNMNNNSNNIMNQSQLTPNNYQPIFYNQTQNQVTNQNQINNQYLNGMNHSHQLNQLNLQNHIPNPVVSNHIVPNVNYFPNPDVTRANVIQSVPPSVAPAIYNVGNNMQNVNQTKNNATFDLNLNDDLLYKMSVDIRHPSNPSNLSGNICEIPGIYQGINSHHVAFILMAEHNIKQLNELYAKRSCNSTPVGKEKSILKKNRDCNECIQTFVCHIKTEKLRYGWMLSSLKSNVVVDTNNSNSTKLKLPFNPLILFTLNILTDEIISIRPMKVKGNINHVNNLGQTWVTSDMEVHAVEEVNNIESVSTGNIVRLNLNDISHRSLQQRDASYLIHDPEKINSQQNGSSTNQYNKPLWEKGADVEFFLKLSTRTNKKYISKHRPVYVQAFNVNLPM